MKRDPLSPGKLPEQLLASFLSRAGRNDDTLVTPPAIGEDTGAAELKDGTLLIYTSDPITFSASNIGRSSVIINANDIATSGGKPKWYLATLLVPSGFPSPQVQEILYEIERTCRSHNISLAGGHTEITDAVKRPVVSGTMMTVVSREQYIDKKKAAAGDVIIMTKTAGLEGTAILANELGSRLISAGLTPDELEEARRFAEKISIMEEAELAVKAGGVTALHDVTEGGVATALRELSAAADRVLEAGRKSIPVHPITEKICSILDIDPLGLIGSGSLLICCKPEAENLILTRLLNAGIPAATVAAVGTRGTGSIDLPVFAVDEITRVL